MRSHPLTPRLSPAPGATPAQPPSGATAPSKAASLETPTPALAPVADEDGDLAKAAARAGGFHESSYELQHGLQVSESEWPDDVTVPAPLGDR